MIKAVSILLLLTICHITYGQIDAVLPDSTLDKYYINYPFEKRPLYGVGDTVAAVYTERRRGWEETYRLVFRYPPPTKPKPVHVVRAIVTELDPKGDIGIKIKIFSIEKHHKNTVTYLEDYITPYSHCLLKRGKELWRERYDWNNTTGLYRISKFTDNYKVGDTIQRTYLTRTSLLGGVLGTGRTKHYGITARIRGVDTTDAQRLLLEFMSINYYNTKRNKHRVEQPVEMEYEYVNVRVGDLVWTKPYFWLHKGQHVQMNGGEKIPDSMGIIIGCAGMKFIIYDCEGNRLYSNGVYGE